MRNIAKHARNLKKAASMLKRDECNFNQLARNFLPTCAQLVARNFWHLRVTYEKLRASLDMIKKESKDFLRATFEKLRAS